MTYKLWTWFCHFLEMQKKIQVVVWSCTFKCKLSKSWAKWTGLEPFFHFLRTSKMFKSGPFWWWWKNTNNWGCNATMQHWQWKALTNFNLWWDTNTFAVTLSGIWKNRSEIFHGTFCIQRRPRCTLQELGEQENSWFVSQFLLDSKGQLNSEWL